MAAHACKAKNWEVEAGLPRVQDHLLPMQGILDQLELRPFQPFCPLYLEIINSKLH